MFSSAERAQLEEHERWMRVAWQAAHEAQARDEVPIGTCVVADGELVAVAGNRTRTDCDPTAHAEIVALRAAAQKLGNYRLAGATLCVTVEPCAMCVGALVHARIATLVYGAAEPKSGALASAIRGDELPGFNHRFEV